MNNRFKVHTFRSVVEGGWTVLELAVTALVSEPGVASVQVGAKTSEQVEANVAAGKVRPTPTELDELASP